MGCNGGRELLYASNRYARLLLSCMKNTRTNLIPDNGGSRALLRRVEISHEALSIRGQHSAALLREMRGARELLIVGRGEVAALLRRVKRPGECLFRRDC